jgi:hypothetical protein
MSKIKIARWKLLKVLFVVNLDTLSLREILPYINNSNGSISYILEILFKTFTMVYGSPSNSLGMRRYEFFHPTTQPEN